MKRLRKRLDNLIESVACCGRSKTKIPKQSYGSNLDDQIKEPLPPEHSKRPTPAALRAAQDQQAAAHSAARRVAQADEFEDPVFIQRKPVEGVTYASHIESISCCRRGKAPAQACTTQSRRPFVEVPVDAADVTSKPASVPPLQLWGKDADADVRLASIPAKLDARRCSSVPLPQTGRPDAGSRHTPASGIDHRMPRCVVSPRLGHGPLCDYGAPLGPVPAHVEEALTDEMRQKVLEAPWRNHPAQPDWRPHSPREPKPERLVRRMPAPPLNSRGSVLGTDGRSSQVSQSPPRHHTLLHERLGLSPRSPHVPPRDSMASPQRMASPLRPPHDTMTSLRMHLASKGERKWSDYIRRDDCKKGWDQPPWSDWRTAPQASDAIQLNHSIS